MGNSHAIAFIIGMAITSVMIYTSDYLNDNDEKAMEISGCNLDLIDGMTGCPVHDPNEKRYKLENGTIMTISR